jgi:Tol biopolymer transport system component
MEITQMHRRTAQFTLAALLVAAAAGLAQSRRQQDIDLQAAIRKETIDGDLSGAIKQYRAIVAKYKSDRAVVAMALVHMADAYRKRGDAQAQKLYEQVVRDYADQKEAVALAHSALGATGMPGGAGPTRKLLCAGPDCLGVPSPDGKSVVSYSGALRIVDLGTHKASVFVDLAPGTIQCCRRFSPDSSRIVFTIRGSGTIPTQGGTVDVINSDGSGRRTVYPGGTALAWSADGKRLLVGRNPEGKPRNFVALLWLDLATGAAQDLPTAHFNLDEATVSPDGRYIAFNAGKDAEAEENVYLMASDGSGETVLAASPAYQEPVGWTLDGKHFLYSQYYESSARLWALPVVNGKPQGGPIDLHTELDMSSFGGVSLSGAVLYHSRASNADIYTATLDPATGKVTSAPVLVPLARTGGNTEPRWAPDSRRLAYEWQHRGMINGRVTDLHEISIYAFDTGEDKRVAAPGRFAVPAYCWSGDGSSMLLNLMDNQNHPVVSRYDLSDARISPLFAGMPTFSVRSCSGDAVAGFTTSGTEAHLEVRSLANGSVKDIYTTPAGVLIFPVISHNGRAVAFAEPSRGGTVLRIVPSDGGAPRDVLTVNPLAELPGGWSVAWSADDRYLYFVQKAAGQSIMQLFRIPVSGGTPESAGLACEELLRAITIAPDGTRIAFVEGMVDRPEIWMLENYLPSAKK